MTERHRTRHTAEENQEPVSEEQPNLAVDAEQTAELGDEAAALQAALEAERARADEEHDRYLRALADFANFRRRQEERESANRQFATRELILKLLSIVDDFERALTSAEEAQSFEALHEGLQLTLRKIHQLLEAEGVRPIEAVGQEFDPMVHEAVMRVEDESHPDNTVVQEHQKGYTLDSQVIRPSRVTVSVTR